MVPDGNGGFTKILPEGESAGQVLAALAPPGARFVKAFGTQSAQILARSSGRQPPTVQFYATDDQAAGAAVAGLIRVSSRLYSDYLNSYCFRHEDTSHAFCLG